MAKATYREIEYLLACTEPFEGNSLSAHHGSDGLYHVVSYATEIATVSPGGRVLFFDDTYFSQTTARHQGCIRRAFDLTHSREVYRAPQITEKYTANVPA